MLFSKENAFHLLSPCKDVDMTIKFIQMNVICCWEDLYGTLIAIVILKVLQGNAAPEASL